MGCTFVDVQQGYNLPDLKFKMATLGDISGYIYLLFHITNFEHTWLEIVLGDSL